MHTRRDFGKLAFGAAALAGSTLRLSARVSGPRFGATTWSLRELTRIPGQDNVKDLIRPLKDAGVREIDLWSYNTEPAGPNTGPGAPPPPAVYPIKIKKFTPEEIAAALAQARELLRDFRMHTPAGYYEGFKSAFDAAGIAVSSYNVKYDDSFTDDEIDVTFRNAKSLGAASITAPGKTDIAKRLAPFADKHGMNVTVSDYKLAGALPSTRFKLNVDIGAISAANESPVAFLQEHSAMIGQVTIKDRRRNQGKNEQYGEGDTPVRDVLRLIRDKEYTFPVYAEYEYIGLGTPSEELSRCMDYMRAAVA